MRETLTYLAALPIASPYSEKLQTVLKFDNKYDKRADEEYARCV